jgi:transcriptional regulator with XRE-family HTH domain
MRAGALVARNIRRLRVAKGLSQEILAVDAEIVRTYVSRLERGLKNPTVAVLERLAEALSADIEELFRVPRAGELAPKPLKGGRRPKRLSQLFATIAGSFAQLPARQQCTA